MEEKKAVLITGLGNPGLAYETTRHNIGNIVVKSFAKMLGWSFSRVIGAKGKIAEGDIKGTKVRLFIPSTYMNESGVAVQKCLNFYKMETSSLLVLADDIYLPLGKFRLREKGTSGGHNGLKSVEKEVGTTEYSRLRIGIGNQFLGALEDYVLSPFAPSEMEEIPEVLKNSYVILDYWLQGDIARAKEFASSAGPNISEGEVHETNS